MMLQINSSKLKKVALFTALALSSSFFTSQDALASGKAFPMPQATRLVVFHYNPNQTYTILTRPNAITDIVLSPGEKVEALALGNTVQWVVAKTAGNIFIKPTVPNIYTSGTLVTNKRIYELSFRSSPENGAWYQRVSWAQPKILFFNSSLNNSEDDNSDSYSPSKSEADAESLSDNENSSSNIPVDQISDIKFGYTISGDASFKPSEVFNNGKFTWIKLPSTSTIIPVFFIRRDGKDNIANYSIKNNYIIVHQVFKHGILGADGKQVSITYNG